MYAEHRVRAAKVTTRSGEAPLLGEHVALPKTATSATPGQPQHAQTVRRYRTAAPSVQVLSS